MTICVQDRLHLFGEITDDKSVLNVAGVMVEKWWAKLPEKFRTIVLDEYIIMSNHIHGIIVINEPTIPVGADPCVSPDVGRHMDEKKSRPMGYIMGKHTGWLYGQTHGFAPTEN